MWLMPNDIKPIVGHSFHFKARAKKKLDFDGHIACEVLEVTPHKRFSYTWTGGGKHRDKPTLNSVVTWTLRETDAGTELTLEHSGFKGLRNYPAYFIMNLGWLKIGKRFLTRLNHLAHGRAHA